MTKQGGAKRSLFVVWLTRGKCRERYCGPVAIYLERGIQFCLVVVVKQRRAGTGTRVCSSVRKFVYIGTHSLEMYGGTVGKAINARIKAAWKQVAIILLLLLDG